MARYHGLIVMIHTGEPTGRFSPEDFVLAPSGAVLLSSPEESEQDGLCDLRVPLLQNEAKNRAEFYISCERAHGRPSQQMDFEGCCTSLFKRLEDR